MSTPVNHHYIPQVYIKGFTNSKGQLYGYNKKTGRIDPYSSAKSVFYEKNRNTMTTVTMNNQPYILESVYYKYFDDRFAPAIKYFKDTAMVDILKDKKKFMSLSEFILTLLLRIPKFDKGLNKVANEFGSFSNELGDEINDKRIIDEFKDDESFIKLQRFYLIDKILEDNRAIPDNVVGEYMILNNSQDVYVLGDYPIIFPVEPPRFDRIMGFNKIFPINKNRLFYTHYGKNLERLHSMHLDINAIIIDQSEHYIVGANREIIEASVDRYNYLKDLRPSALFEAKMRLFTKFN
jgi:hypothetical protein